MPEEKQEKLPIDARLLSEAVIELNISRRSVGLYPQEHPIIKNSIKRAFELLQKLFELRSNITLGIARNTLVIDEYTLDRKNPVFEEFALSLHDKGITAITFYSGMEPDELIYLHEIITMFEGPAGESLVELAVKKGIKHIKLTPFDLSSFSFIEGELREGGTENKIWEDYVYGLLSGKLADKDAEIVVFNIPPEHIANFINAQMPVDAPDETYDRVISSYIRRREHKVSSRKSFERFESFISNLGPELKAQFLKRAFSQAIPDELDVEKMLANITEEDLQKMLIVFKEQSSTIPESLRNLVDKLTEIKAANKFTVDSSYGIDSFVDDIEIDENILRLLEKDNFAVFVGEEYQRDLEMMLRSSGIAENNIADMLRQACSEKTLDQAFAELMLELISLDSISREDYLNLLNKLSDFANIFLDTGRFNELCDTYATLHSQSLSGRFRTEASGMVDYFFRSEQFIQKLIDAFKLWGRYDRDGAVKIVRLLKLNLIGPMFDALSSETDASIRKLLLSILSALGSDVINEAVKRLGDERWYVVRNMIYVIRECGNKRYEKQYIKRIRELAKSKHPKICIEAAKTLLHFNTPDAPSYLKYYLKKNDLELREQAVKLSGTYKVKDSIPYLIELLEKKDPFGNEAYNKIPVVKALGEIGDARAIEPLIKIYNSKPFFFRNAAEELKAEIFRTASKYHADAIRPLLELGIKSKNEEIRSISENILKENSKGVES